MFLSWDTGRDQETKGSENHEPKTKEEMGSFDNPFHLESDEIVLLSYEAFVP